MKEQHPFVPVLFILALVMLSGCITPEPVTVKEEVIKEVQVIKQTEIQLPPETLVPLTPSILQRLGGSPEKLSEEIKKYQVILSGRVALEMEYTISNDTLEKGGKVSFEDVHVREVVTINDQTEGITALMEDRGSGEYALSVCFETENDFSLTFSNMPGEPEPYFYLNYHLNGNFSAYHDEKGTLVYGGNLYKLKFSGEKRPFLLIKLSQRDTDRLNARTASGRKIEN